jgi:23S rRNA (uridine2552-2'-O)-methyltransferase
MKIQSKSKKVKAWLQDHVNDPYVKLAQRDGYRARAAYKLKEIDEALGLLKPGQLVVDLGAAPGAWSQYVRRKFAPKQAGSGGAAVGELKGTIIALDILDFEPLEGVHFIQGDFREEAVATELAQALGGRAVDVVVSDMAPNLTGIATADAAGRRAFGGTGGGVCSGSPHRKRCFGVQSVPRQWSQPVGQVVQRQF